MTNDIIRLTVNFEINDPTPFRKWVKRAFMERWGIRFDQAWPEAEAARYLIEGFLLAIHADLLPGVSIEDIEVVDTD